MTHYVIVILMFVALGMDGPDKDALEISHKDGKPLLFDTFEQCVDHVNENIVELFKIFTGVNSGEKYLKH